MISVLFASSVKDMRGFLFLGRKDLNRQRLDNWTQLCVSILCLISLFVVCLNVWRLWLFVVRSRNNRSPCVRSLGSVWCHCRHFCWERVNEVRTQTLLDFLWSLKGFKETRALVWQLLKRGERWPWKGGHRLESQENDYILFLNYFFVQMKFDCCRQGPSEKYCPRSCHKDLEKKCHWNVFYPCCCQIASCCCQRLLGFLNKVKMTVRGLNMTKSAILTTLGSVNRHRDRSEVTIR